MNPTWTQQTVLYRLARCYALAAVTWSGGCSGDAGPAGSERDAASETRGDAHAPDGPEATRTDAAARDAAASDGASSDAAGDAAAVPADASDELDAQSDAAAQDGDASDAAAGAQSGDAALVDVDAQVAVPDAAAPDSGMIDTGAPGVGSQDGFVLRVVTEGLEAPWEVSWGPDGKLWISERQGKRVVRVDPVNGTRSVALEVADAHQSGAQDGVLGLALHPDLLRDLGRDYVYLAYTYDADTGAALDRRAKVVRYTYDAATRQLGAPLTLIDRLPASTDHNAGRLIYGPDAKLYYSIGDQGNNQFERKCQLIRAQELPTQAELEQGDLSKYVGKILRLELDGQVPEDNPQLAGVRSHVYTYGHRNPQGLAFGPDGKLYADEQGPKTDDEVNWLQAGHNYGWPRVAGYRDDRAYVYGNWSASPVCEELAFSDYALPPSVPTARESDWTDPSFTPPLTTFYTVNSNYSFMDPACAGNQYICWPTIAPSSLEVYVAGQQGLSTWGTSLLLTSLKQGSVFRVRLSENGDATVDTTRLFKTTNRYRDLAVGPDKQTFYVITDASGSTASAGAGATDQLQHRGAVLEFRPAP